MGCCILRLLKLVMLNPAMAGPPVANMGPCGAHHASDVIMSSWFLPLYLIKVFLFN